MGGPTRREDRGFTLLELVIAVTLLAAFVLPILQVMAQSRNRATRYTQLRQVQSLAQEKLHDYIHYVIHESEGTFEEEARRDGQPLWARWTWRIEETMAGAPGLGGAFPGALGAAGSYGGIPGAAGAYGGIPGTAGAYGAIPGMGGAYAPSPGEQVVLQYTIRVETSMSMGTSGASAAGTGFESERSDSTYEYSVWAIPNKAWYLEQQELFDRGMPSLLYGDPLLDPAVPGTGGF